MKRLATAGLALAGILVLALALRLWGIGFGLPYAYHFDEPTYVSAALNLGARIIGRQPNPTGFSNLLFGEYAVYFVAGRLVGWFASVGDFERAYRLDPTAFLLLGRVTSALLGTLNVLAVYQVGKTWAHRGQGLLAALFLAVAFLHVRDSHYGVPDITAACLVSVTVVFCLLMVRQPARGYSYLAAATGGLAIAVKWSVWPLLITLSLAVFFRWQMRGEKLAIGQLSRYLLSLLLCFVGGLILGGFQLFLKPAVYLEYALREAAAGEGGGFGAWQIDTVAGWLFYLKTAAYGLGLVFLALAVLGGLWRAVQAVRNRDRLSLLLLSFPVCYYLIMGATRHYFARYALPLVPFAAVFAAEPIWALAQMDTRQQALAKGLAALLAVAVLAQPLASSVQHDRLLGAEDTRTVAKSWIEANVPAGAKIAVDWPVHGPPLSTPERGMPGSSAVYNVVTLGGTGLADHDLQWYKEQGFNYLVTSSFITDLSLVDQARGADRSRFYTSLDRELSLLQEIRPYVGDTAPAFIFDEIYGPAVSLWQRNQPGPTLKIYKLSVGQ
jgi:4-amino-4-deoxy-L-arabinose transferase-like glycosyltransferase